MFKLANVHSIQREFAILKMPASSCAVTGDLKEEILEEKLLVKFCY